MGSKIIAAIVAVVLAAGLVFFVSVANKGGRFGLPSSLKPAQTLITEGKLDDAKAKIDEAALASPDLKALGKVYFELAGAYEKSGELVKARDIYVLILDNHQNIDNIAEVQDNLGKLNIKILFSKIVTDDDLLYAIEPGDTLFRIAKKFGTTVELIKTSNSLTNDVIQARSKLKVSKVKYKILVDKSQNILIFLKSDDKIFKVYRISTGENNCTPVGIFQIVNRIKDPVWYNEGAIVPSESPDNILGSHWLGLSIKGYGIHGTIEPESVGRQTTKGCVRMLNDDVEELYTIVPAGTEVTIVD